LFKGVGFVTVNDNFADMAKDIVGVSAFIAGVTISSRLARLVQNKVLQLSYSALAFLAGVTAYKLLVEDSIQSDVASAFAWLTNLLPDTIMRDESMPLVIVALLVSA